MEFKQQIQSIINDRKVLVKQIESELDKIGKLKSKLVEASQKISLANIERSQEYTQKIDQTVINLEKAETQARLLKARFDKDTINIGVSGFSHAGKTELLKAISGLPDYVLTAANNDSGNSLHATTALCSQIFNDANERAEISFKSEKAFVEFINFHLKDLGIDYISYSSQLADLKLPSLQDAEGDKNVTIIRLNEIKEAYPYYKDLINKQQTFVLRPTEFKEICKYTTYQTDCKEYRFFPAVAEVKIYCKFPSLVGANQDTKLCLVDLPGFGVYTADDVIMTRGLRDRVDHIAFVYMTNSAEGIEREKYRRCQNVIKEIVGDLQKTKLQFETFIINQNKKSDVNWANLTQQTENSINAVYGAYDKFAFSALEEPEKSREALNSILVKLSTSLRTMDGELLDAYKSNRDLTEVSEVLDSIDSMVRKNSMRTGSSVFSDKAKALRNRFDVEVGELLKLYKESAEEEDQKFASQVDELQNEIDTLLEDNVMYQKVNIYETWEDKIKSDKARGLLSQAGEECQRLWVAIISKYENLNSIFEEKLKTLKQQIIAIFSKCTNNIVQENAEVCEVVEMLKDFENNSIKNAFVFLQDLKQDFRQNIYPFLFKENRDLCLTTYDDQDKDGGEVEIDLKTDKSIQNFKNQIVNYATIANDKISKTIKSNFMLSFYYYGAIDTFREKLIRDKSDNDNDYIDFCEIFRTRLYPNEFGNESDSFKMQEIKALVEEIKVLKNSF